MTPTVKTMPTLRCFYIVYAAFAKYFRCTWESFEDAQGRRFYNVFVWEKLKT